MSSIDKVTLTEGIDFLQKFLDAAKNQNLSILEAGCGSITKLKFSDKHFITGIDISQQQLERNNNVNEKIQGDIQYYEFPGEKFDLIVCWHVLEHVQYPRKAINNFISCLKKDGRIVIVSPNPWSLKGLITKFTPHFFHVFVYRYFYGLKDAGKKDTAPFKTFMRFSIVPENISSYAESRNIRTEIIGTDDAINSWIGIKFKEKSKILYSSIILVMKLLNTISFGKINDSEFMIILKK